MCVVSKPFQLIYRTHFEARWGVAWTQHEWKNNNLNNNHKNNNPVLLMECEQELEDIVEKVSRHSAKCRLHVNIKKN